MPVWDRDSVQLRFDHLVTAGNHHDFERFLDSQESSIQLLDGSHAEAARELQNDGTLSSKSVACQARGTLLRLAEYRMNRNSGHADVGTRHAPGLQVQRALLGGGEIVLARLVNPESMGLEIRGHRHLRHAQ